MRCHNCGTLGHFTRDCPLLRVQLGAGLNAIGVQEEQHENELIAMLRGQVDLQHQLLATQEGRIQQNDVKVATLAARGGLMGGPGASVSQLAAMGSSAFATPQLILGGAQPPGYEFVGQNLGMVESVCCLLVLNLVSSTLPCIRRPRQRLLIWGHPDIVQASITDEGDKK